MNFLSASAARPSFSCTAARADQAPHQSSQDFSDAVTSSKSDSTTPWATKRGAQWWIAEVTRVSVVVTPEDMDESLRFRIAA